MPNQIVLTPQAGNLPAGFCPPDYQSILNAFAAAMTVTIPFGQNLIILVQPTTPGPAFQTGGYIWAQLDNTTVGGLVRFYWFANGAWLSRHPWPPNSIMLYDGAKPGADWNSFDGGDGTATVGPQTGPMWQEVTQLQGRFPVGVGTTPAAPTGTGQSLALAQQGGEEVHLLTTSEGAFDTKHSHATGKFNALDATYLIGAPVQPSGSAFSYFAYRNTGNGQGTSPGNIDPTGTSPAGDPASGPWVGTSRVVYPADTPPVLAAHNTMPQFYALYFLRRTARLYYAFTA